MLCVNNSTHGFAKEEEGSLHAQKLVLARSRKGGILVFSFIRASRSVFIVSSHFFFLDREIGSMSG